MLKYMFNTKNTTLSLNLATNQQMQHDYEYIEEKRSS